MFDNKKRGQAAMEFLMTYGWAILAAIIVIGVLAIYFRPSQLTSDTFVVTAPFYGVGTSIGATSIQVEVRNNGGETVTTNNATLTFNSPSTATCNAGTGLGSLSAGGTQVITFASCTNIASGDSVNADIAVQYQRPASTLNLTSTGTVSGTAA